MGCDGIETHSLVPGACADGTGSISDVGRHAACACSGLGEAGCGAAGCGWDWSLVGGGAMGALVAPRLRVGFVLGSGGFSGVGGAMGASRPLTALADSGTSPRFAGRGGAGGGVDAGSVSVLGVKLAMR